ncbi:MAG: DUF4276 family protein [Dechloromonas sp.]|uniref:DUF4276 family protein n=1 Tax=Candidatus Dechloromonas phosphorivorans TaxID=2899244 RepID=A0A935K3D0_9RHOO|nr:DUF4276 family protein [Candidatus Dechloromonas phosphorivorans]
MKELVFLLEEESAKAMLESLLPRILNPEIQPRFIPFEGKQDLERQMTKRLRGYINQQARFIVLRDQDSAPDCLALKKKLAEHCQNAGKAGKTLVRIACRELESFYLADLAAVEQALKINGLTQRQGSAKFRNPDRLGRPSKDLETQTHGNHQKVIGSREIGSFLNSANERSASFKNLVSGIRKLENELLNLA